MTHSALLVGDFAADRRGNRSVAQDLAERLTEIGWQIHTTVDATAPLAKLVRIAADVWRHSKRADLVAVDLFSGRAFWWADLATLIAKARNRPLVIVLRGGALPSYAERHPARVHRLLVRADRVLSPSGYLAQALASEARPVEVIPNPISLASFPFRHRRQLAPRIVWIRSLRRIYNPVLAVRILAIVRERFPGATLTMFGADHGDSSAQEIRSAVARHGLEDALRIAGPIPHSEVPRALDSHDIFLNTTTVDNTPVSVVEALASGLPVVSTQVGGIPFLLDQGRTGLLFADGDAAAGAGAVSRLLEQFELASRLSTSGRQLAETMDWDRVLPLWCDLFDSVLRERRPGR